MKFSIKSNQLKNKALILKRSFNQNHSLPVLKGIYLEAKENQIIVKATDLYFGVSFTINAKVEEEGQMIITGQQFLEVINSLNNNQEIVFQVEEGGKKVLLKTKKLKIKLPLINNGEFPEFPVISNDGIMLTLKQIKLINEYVISSASTDKTRPILTGIYLSFSKDKINAVTTDGYRLAMMSLNSKTHYEESVIIPARVFVDLEKTMIEEKVDRLVLEINKEQFQARCLIDQVEVYIRLIEGEYPPYKKIIPNNFNLNVIFNASSLLEVLKQAKIFSRSNSNIVQLKIKKDSLEVYANASDMSYYSYEFSDVQVSGDGFNLAFNITYLIDILNKAGDDEVELMAVESLRPAKFLIRKNKNLSYIIMPIKIHQ